MFNRVLSSRHASSRTKRVFRVLMLCVLCTLSTAFLRVVLSSLNSMNPAPKLNAIAEGLEQYERQVSTREGDPEIDV
ncbi:MAG: hypothetical protein AB8B91_15395 [Rubripirellula sp.]